MSVAVDPLSSFAAITQVGVLGHDAHFARLVEEIGERLLLLGNAFPNLDRIGFVEVACAVHEVLVFFERHLGVLRAGVTGPLRADPAEFAAGAAVHENLVEWFAGGRCRHEPFGIDVAERLGVFVGPNAE